MPHYANQPDRLPLCSISCDLFGSIKRVSIPPCTQRPWSGLEATPPTITFCSVCPAGMCRLGYHRDGGWMLPRSKSCAWWEGSQGLHLAIDPSWCNRFRWWCPKTSIIMWVSTTGGDVIPWSLNMNWIWMWLVSTCCLTIFKGLAWLHHCGFINPTPTLYRRMPYRHIDRMWNAYFYTQETSHTKWQWAC